MIDAIWSFFTAPENRETLSWLGGSIVAAAGAIWTVVGVSAGKGTAGQDEGASASRPGQELLADRGGIAAGGTVNQNTRISSGVSDWQLECRP